MSEPLLGIAQKVWTEKYRFSGGDGLAGDATIEDTWRRVAAAAAAVEGEDKRSWWTQQFYAALEDFRFLPAGRILSGAGTGRRVTLFNCFVMGRIEDDLASIFDNVKEAALTMQQGGGIGHDFSTLRPKGAPVKGVGADASGPLSFMDVWDAMCRTIMSAGSRRGAMMGTMRCDHPDIEDFIAAKADAARLRMFNLSVLVTDAFMQAVEADAAWDLVFAGKVYKTVQARHLWDAIMRATYDYAEPGVIFIDRVNAQNPLNYCETIQATNPCGEQPLPPHGACLLGSLNLARLVRGPFSASARIDEAELAALTTTAVRLLDNVIDISRYPLDAQMREAFAKRRIGLGLTGLADALVMCGLAYGSQEAAQQAGEWMRAVQVAAYRASAALAEEKGAFPLYDQTAYAKSPSLARLDVQTRELVARHGVRNALLTSIAPTGTISLLAGNVSSGVEPIFSLSYRRRLLNAAGGSEEEDVCDYAFRRYRSMYGPEAALPDTFVTAQTLAPADHLNMQAALQPYVDSAISKTINVPQDASFAAFRDIYAQAYRLGLKGCTTYRPNEVTGSVLSLAPAAGHSERQESLPLDAPMSRARAAGEVVYLSEPLAREGVLPGFTYKIKWPESDHAIYITINDIERDGRRRPFEIFINSKNMEHYAWTVGLTRMISAVFRRGGDVSFVVEELKGVFDPRGGQWMQGSYVPSLLAAIGGVIEKHMIDIGFLPGGMSAADESRLAQKRYCPKCDAPALVFQEGCHVCLNCGFAKCG